MRTYSLDDFPPQLSRRPDEVMTLDTTRLLLATAKPFTLEDVDALVAPYDLMTEDKEDRQERQPSFPSKAVNYTDQLFWVRRHGNKSITPELFTQLQQGIAASLDWLGPVYRVGDQPGRLWLLCPFPHVVLVQEAESLTDDEQATFARLMDEFGATESQIESQYLGGYRYYVLDEKSLLTAYQVRDLLIQHPTLVNVVDFETMPMIRPLAAVPNDPYYKDYQWCMRQIHAGGAASGAQTQTQTGWDKSTGDPGEVICIFDTGCDLGHPDLRLTTGYNCSTHAPSGAPVPPVNEPKMAGHGTCCAGIAAAKHNNAEGVAGVAGNCVIMPVTAVAWTNREIAQGINWAAEHGASVISMSFGDITGDTVIDNAIQRVSSPLFDCVLVAATGDYDVQDPYDQVLYPAMHPLVIAVGGSDEDDKRKTMRSRDGEDWGANFGPGISVAAPCVSIATTDIRGNQGFNINRGGPLKVAGVWHKCCGDPEGKYFFWFNGTSASTPMVAGLAAVIRGYYRLCTNGRKLPNGDVRDIIEQTADKVPDVTMYTQQRPNGTWNEEMGYGRINMLKSLQEVEWRASHIHGPVHPH